MKEVKKGIRLSMSPYREQDWFINYPLYSVQAVFFRLQPKGKNRNKQRDFSASKNVEERRKSTKPKEALR